jgi:hypothetical protein
MTDRAAYGLAAVLAVTFLALPVAITVKAAQLVQQFQPLTTITTK